VLLFLLIGRRGGISMRQLVVSDDVHEQVTLLARAWDTSASEAIRRLLRDFRGVEREASQADVQQEAVHAIYAGSRTDGVFDIATQALTITTGVLAGRTFSRPSGAAVALVQALSPGVHPNRNGWSFWVVSRTGKRLQSIRPSQPRGS
jgi:hypothetical protein